MTAVRCREAIVMLESFVVHWGYVAVVVGTFFEGEAILLAGGALAHRGLLSLPLVMLAAFGGSVAGDQTWFWLGRRYGRAFLDRRPTWAARVARVERWIGRYELPFVVGFRFVYGVRTATPVALGASGYPTVRFVALDTLGGAAWAAAVGGAGFALGHGLEVVARRAARIEEIAAVVLIVAVGARLARRRRAAR